jgi:RNA polymerase sigma-32 factor
LEALGYDGSPKLLAERLDVNERKLIEMDQRLGGRDISLDDPFGDSKEGLGAVLPLVAKGADEHLEEKELKQLLREKLKTFSKSLKKREREILHKRILAESPVTLQSLADTYHISKERVRQLEQRLLEQLESYLKREFQTMDALLLDAQSDQKEKREEESSSL